MDDIAEKGYETSRDLPEDTRRAAKAFYKKFKKMRFNFVDASAVEKAIADCKVLVDRELGQFCLNEDCVPIVDELKNKSEKTIRARVEKMSRL
jgi:hypothetical protein